MLADSLPNWPVNPLLATSPWFNFQIDLMRCMWAIFPAAFLWGASFPFALAAAAAPRTGPGRTGGRSLRRQYRRRILGALAFSIALIPWIGTQNCQRLLIALSAVSALVVFVPARAALSKAGRTTLIASVVAAIALIATVSPMPWIAIAYGRRMATTTDAGRPLYIGEGTQLHPSPFPNCPTASTIFTSAEKWKPPPSPTTCGYSACSAHIPALLHPNPTLGADCRLRRRRHRGNLRACTRASTRSPSAKSSR